MLRYMHGAEVMSQTKVTSATLIYESFAVQL